LGQYGIMAWVEQMERSAEAMSGANSQGEASSACVVACPTALQRIAAPDKALAVWQRSLDGDVVAQLGHLVLDEVDDLLFTSEIDALEAALIKAMESGGYPDMPALRRDIAMLAGHHAAVTDDRKVRIRLEVVETDACRKFHTDYVKVRSITTYLGQGTQWIEAASAEISGTFGGPDIHQLKPGDVGMFKGRLWQEVPTILHRSPPIGASGEQRLVLVIDPVPHEDEAAVRLGGACS
jgi:hypothetical protein